jgi:hypothetical protein
MSMTETFSSNSEASLMSLPVEIFSIVVNYLGPAEHRSLIKTCKSFSIIYLLIRSLVLDHTNIKDLPRYSQLKTLMLKNCVPEGDSPSTVTNLFIDFNPAYRRRHTIDFKPLFLWMKSLELVELNCNIPVDKYYLPSLLSKSSLKKVHYEFLISGTVQTVNPTIEELSIIIVPSNKYIDFSPLKKLRKIHIWGILTSCVKDSLLSIPSLEEVNMTLLGLDEGVDISQIPFGKVDLSGYKGMLEPFAGLKNIDRIVFPPQVKLEDLEPFSSLKKCHIAAFDAIDFGIIDRCPYYQSYSEMVASFYKD